MKPRNHHFTQRQSGIRPAIFFRAIVLSSFLYSSLCMFASGEWTRFRGPNGTGVAEGNTRQIPTEWKNDDVRWSVDLPGKGHSSPVVWGDRIFLTSADKDRGVHMNLCLSVKDGKILWSRESEFSDYRIHGFNSFASTTPAVTEDRVYFFESTPAGQTLKAYDHDGELKWSRDFSVKISEHGNGVSPMVYRDKVILSNEQEGGSFLIALDQNTGETVWKTRRDNAKASFATPCVYTPEGQADQLVFVSMAHGITGVDPENGKVLWEADDLFDKRTVSSPVVAGDYIIGTCGSGGGGNYLVAVKPSKTETGFEAQMEFRVRRAAPYVPTPIYKNDRLYLWNDGGIVSCIDTKTGETLWSERVGGRYFGSPILLDDRILCVSDTGEAVWVAAADEFKILGRVQLPEGSNATPAFVNGTLYLRTESGLISVGGATELIVE